MSDGIFSRIIVPRDPIVLEECEEVFLIPYKAFLIGEDIFRSIGFVQNHLAVKLVNGFPKMLEILLLQPVLLHSVHNRKDEVAYCGDDRFQFCIKGDCPQVIIQVSDEVYPTFLLAASHGIIGRIKI